MTFITLSFITIVEVTIKNMARKNIFLDSILDQVDNKVAHHNFKYNVAWFKCNFFAFYVIFTTNTCLFTYFGFDQISKNINIFFIFSLL